MYFVLTFPHRLLFHQWRKFILPTPIYIFELQRRSIIKGHSPAEILDLKPLAQHLMKSLFGPFFFWGSLYAFFL